VIRSTALASLRAAFTLFAFALAGTALISYTFEKTRGIIEAEEQQAKLALIRQVLPAGIYDNDLLADSRSVPPSELLGTGQPTTAYIARRAGEPTAVVLEAVAPDGYHGAIRMLVGILRNGEVAGVRVIAHDETPGIGDYIEAGKSRWILSFRGKELSPGNAEQWKVRKDGGIFDYVAGATASPRAVVKAVKNALTYFERNQQALFAKMQERHLRAP
jgi:Na+-translocating ferredoxin:NAD+ oxidoreductase subunit G